jgi:calcineurin-like phosphoesterase family protein
MRSLLPLLLLAFAVARGELLSPVWVELGEGGRAVARVVAAAAQDCPSVEIGGRLQPMLLRQPVPAGFRPLCELAIPVGALAARVNGQALALPRPDPVRVIVIGDTGCRILGGLLQDCNDPQKWPFEHVAGTAARARPDLVVHVGDYLYREDPCPANAQAQCGGTPSGDNWGAWNADFFKPAAPLLAAAPWIFSRGNHENCARSWRGWFYYLDPRPWTGVCQTASPPYSVQLGKFQAIAFDSSAVNEIQVIAEQLKTYTAQLGSVHATHAWLVDHHPFWAVRPGLGILPPTPQTAVLEDAWDQAAPKGIDMVLSGHTHLFEILSFGENRPVQIVAGDGGTNLADPLPERLNGVDIHGVMVTASQNQHEFGYTLFTRRGAGWGMSLRDLRDRELVNCRIENREAACSGRVVGRGAAK